MSGKGRLLKRASSTRSRRRSGLCERKRVEVGALTELGRLLLIMGAVLLVVGFILLLFGRVPFVGRLPGDILIKREGFTFYFPIATSILISVILSLLLYLFRR